MDGLYAGLDVSTQSTKLVVIDAKKKQVVHVGSVHYDSDLPEYNTQEGAIQGLKEGDSESDPQMWIDACLRAFEHASSSGVPVGQIRCLSVSGQQHGLVALDATGNLARLRSKLWNDFSTLEECRILTERTGGLEAMIAEVGNSQRTGYTASKIFHMFRHEPENYRRAATLFLVHNYINWYLTGGGNRGVRVMEPGDTSGMALWNPKTGRWSRKVIEAIGPGVLEKLPPVELSDRSIGRISKELTERFGFSPEMKIDAGSGDNMYGAVGTGNIRPGIVTVSLGTSGTAYTVLEEPYFDPEGEIAAFCDSTGRFLPLLCISNLANGYNELLSRFGLSHEEFNTVIEATAPGNGGRLLVPWYVGERTPDLPQATPLYFGFGLGEFTEQILCRTVLEGHVLNLYDGFCRMPVKAEEIRLTGGLSRSEAWCRAIADIFEAQVVPVEGEGAALGAALHAAWVWMKEAGAEISLGEIVEPFVRLDESRRKRPDAQNAEIYRVQKQLFSALSRRMRGLAAQDPFTLRYTLTQKSPPR